MPLMPPRGTAACHRMRVGPCAALVSLTAIVSAIAVSVNRKSDTGRVPDSSCMSPLLWDAGIVRPGAKVVHTFTIHNRRNTDIQFKALRATCGCTTSNTSSAYIAAGESAPFDIALLVGNSEEPIRRTAVLEFTDGSGQELIMSGEVRSEMSLSVKSVVAEYWDVSMLGARTWYVDVFNYSAQHWNALSIDSGPGIGASWNPVELESSKASQAFRLSIRANLEQLDEGPHGVSTYVRVSAGGPAGSNAVVRVRFQKIPALRVYPPQLALKPGEKSSGIRLIVHPSVFSAIDPADVSLAVTLDSEVEDLVIDVSRLSRCVYQVTPRWADHDSATCAGNYSALVSLYDGDGSSGSISTTEVPLAILDRSD